MERWYENEDWDVMITRGELACSAEGEYGALVDLRGPGSATRYYVFARLEAGAELPLSGMEIPGEPPCEWQPEPVEVAGTPAGWRWVRLGSAVRRRQYQQFAFRGAPGLPGLHSLWVSQTPRYLLAGRAERQIARGEDREPLSGVPLGGVGAGKVELCRDGRFRNFTLNGNLDTPWYNSDGTFVALHCATEAGHGAWVLSTESLQGLPGVQGLEFEGRYPQARLVARDLRLPVEVELQASGTIIPRNLEDSALPLALLRVRLSNPGPGAVRATVAFSLENWLGCGGSSLAGEERQGKGFYESWLEREGNREEPWAVAEGSGVELIGEGKTEARGQGRYVVATDSAQAAVCCGWRPEKGRALWAAFADSGELPAEAGGPSAGEATAGVVCRRVELAAGESAEVHFVLAWHVPVFWQSLEQDYGHYYETRFAGAGEVAAYGLREFDRLWREAGEVPELLRQSSLPAWLAQSLANDAYVFSTCCWLTRDGRFSVNESPKNMFGCMGTLDQKLYGSHYYSLFFPECDMSELLQFARAHGEDGGIQHDLGSGHLEQTGRPSGWPDLSSSLAIQTLKLYQLTGNEGFLEEMYPHCARALLEWQLGRDSDGDGIANISGVGNTFDSEQFEGTSAYIATVWLAALKALEEMARRRGDTEVQRRAAEVFAKARESAIRELWNGAYFANYYDVERGLRNDNSHFSQLAGEFYTLLLGLGLCYDEAQVMSAQRALLRLNYHPDLVFPTNEATPEGKMARRDLHGWLPHGRVYLAGQSIALGMAEEGLEALERMERALVEVNRDNRWDQRLFYEPDTGREHWGTFYMTAPATWYVYAALVGVLWDKPEGTLGLCPQFPQALLPAWAPVFLPEAWFMLTVSADQRELRLRRVKGLAESLPVRKLRLPERGGEPVVRVDGRLVPLRRRGAGYGYVEYEGELNLAQAEEISVRWEG